MLNLILVLLFLTCCGIVAAWVAENPGSVTIHWFDYRIDTSFAFLLVIALASALILASTWILIQRIMHAPRLLSKRHSLKQYHKGLEELTYSVAALAAADAASAETHTKRAEKLLGRTPLTLLLSAQIARSQGDDAKTRLLLEDMLEHKETEYLAARFLSDSATKQRQFPKALALAQRAEAVNPKGTVSVISLHVRLGQWLEALQAIKQGVRKGRLTRVNATRYRGIVYLQRGCKAFAEGLHEEAAAAARQSLKALPGFAPAVILAVRVLDAAGKQAKAIRLIFHAWKRAPHPALAETLLSLLSKEPKDRQLKLAQKLVKLQPSSSESHLALARFAIAQREWSMARKAVKHAIAQQETSRACKLMADIEQGEYADFDASGTWRARSADALPDPLWICSSCGHAAERWAPHCPACESFDTMEWKTRAMSFAG